MNGVIYIKRAGAVVGRLDIGEAMRANGYEFGPDAADEVQVTVGYEKDGITTNTSLRQFVDGTSIGGAERTGEDAISETFFEAVLTIC